MVVKAKSFASVSQDDEIGCPATMGEKQDKSIHREIYIWMKKAHRQMFHLVVIRVTLR
jgi:hypothetical protein